MWNARRRVGTEPPEASRQDEVSGRMLLHAAGLHLLHAPPMQSSQSSIGILAGCGTLQPRDSMHMHIMARLAVFVNIE